MKIKSGISRKPFLNLSFVNSVIVCPDLVSSKKLENTATELVMCRAYAVLKSSGLFPVPVCRVEPVHPLSLFAVACLHGRTGRRKRWR